MAQQTTRERLGETESCGWFGKTILIFRTTAPSSSVLLPERVHVVERPHESRSEAWVRDVGHAKLAARLLNDGPDRGVVDVADRWEEVVLLVRVRVRVRRGVGWGGVGWGGVGGWGFERVRGGSVQGGLSRRRYEPRSGG